MKCILLDQKAQDSVEYVALVGFSVVIALVAYGILKPKLDAVIGLMF